MDNPEVTILAPGDVVAALLAKLPSLLERSQDLVAPIREQRENIRALLYEQGLLAPLDTETGGLKVGCTDGGYALSPFVIGDHVSTMSVAVHQEDRGNTIGVVAHRQWSDLSGHSFDTETLAKAVMMAHEVELLATLPSDAAKIVDGSFLTHLATIFAALASPDERTRRQVQEVVSTPAFEQGLRTLVEDPYVAACPKSDSSTSLWTHCSRSLDLRGDGVPDKALANLVLEPGEVLSLGAVFSWDRLLVTRGHVSAPEARQALARIRSITDPFVQEGTVNVSFAKPAFSNLCLRIETRADLDPFDTTDLITSICGTVEAPFLQEPMPQYVADIFAKEVSVGANVQSANLRLDLSAMPDSHDLIDYFVRQYRTN